jgi:hypothetical protein
MFHRSRYRGDRFLFQHGIRESELRHHAGAAVQSAIERRGRVAATVTKQYAAGYLAGYWAVATTTPEVDPVFYANGTLAALVFTWWPAGSFFYQANIIYGTLSVRSNSTNPVFAFGPRGLNLAINTNGQISVQETSRPLTRDA